MTVVGGQPQRQGINSVEIGVRVLLAMDGTGGPLALSEISQRAGMEPSKVHRYLVSLCRAGLVSQVPSGHYDYGPTMRRLGAEALRRTNEVVAASERMPALRDSTGHSVNLSVWGDDGPIIVRWDYGTFALPLTVRVGATLPLLRSSAGMVFLATLPESLTQRALAKASGGDAKAQSASKVLRAAKAAVRRTGVVVTHGAVIPGIASISAPVHASGESLPNVLSVVLPDGEMTESERQRVTRLVLETADLISRELGLASQPARQTQTI
jgi:DNA-binding IclR family transcriptional regulator